VKLIVNEAENASCFVAFVLPSIVQACKHYPEYQFPITANQLMGKDPKSELFFKKKIITVYN